MDIDLRSTLRRRKPERHVKRLVPRPREAVAELGDLPAAPLLLLLDTNVYIHRAAGRLAPPVRDAIDRALLFHCSVALAELACGVGNADPRRPGWTAMRDHYAELFASIPASRLLTPDAEVWADAGVIAGVLARVQGFLPDQRKACLNGALIFLTAVKAGVPVLTANRDDFDLISQLAPEGRFVCY